MTRKTRLLLLSAIPLVMLAMPLLIVSVDLLRTNGEIAADVSAAGIELGGLGEEDALAAMTAHERELGSTPLVFAIKDEEFTTEPAAIGLDIDQQGIVDEAMLQRRDEGFWAQVFGWFSRDTEPIELAVPVSYEPELLVEFLDAWELEAIDAPAYEGGLLLKEGRVLPDYPRIGEGLDDATALDLAFAEIQTTSRQVLEVPTLQLVPELTRADIDAAAEDANDLIDSPVTLTAEDPIVEVSFTPEQLAKAFWSEVTINSPTTIQFGLDPNKLRSVVVPLLPDIEQPPRDAEFVVNDDEEVTLLPGRPETKLSIDLVTDRVAVIARTADGQGDFPFEYGIDPDFTNEQAEAMLPMEKMSSFTTSHAAGQPRVTNIHVMADFVDNAVVWPGEEFSLNEYVGERTRAKGYVPAPMILRGEIVDSVGGGVSQFATTFYNAVFFGCYEDVTHKPHSFYFSRYPEVNEATISWPTPDLAFRNDSDAIVIIKTWYTSTKINVSFYGNNGGRSCDRRLGNRTAFTEPEIQYVKDAGLDPDQEVVEQGGATGFTNSVVRVITHDDGQVEEEVYTWRYLAMPRIVRVHPCNIPDSGVECPVEVPNVVGRNVSKATERLEAAGFVVRIGEPIEVDDESEDGIVQRQSTPGGEFAPAGSRITIRVGKFVPPPDEPPDEGEFAAV